MKPSVHLRDPDNPTMAACGAGYRWVSSVALSDLRDEVDCRRCLAMDTVNFPSGADLIAAERLRQITEEGFAAEHDDNHDRGELADAAAYYLTEDISYWPWQDAPHDSSRERNLVKAGALIAAEIDRLRR